MEDVKVRKPPVDIAKIEKTRAELANSEERLNFETLWDNGTEFCRPHGKRVRTTEQKGNRKNIDRVIDYGIEACRGFMKGMYAYAIGTGKFFSAEAEIDGVSTEFSNEEKAWFESIVRIMHNELNASNFAAEIMQGFGELGYIGTTTTYQELYESRLNFRTQTIANYWYDTDARGRPSKMFTLQELKAEQIIDEYFSNPLSSFEVPPKIKGAADRNDTADIKVYACTMQNPKPKPEPVFQDEKPFITVYYVCDPLAVIYVDGHDSFPFHTARLYKAENESYGRSCFMECEKTLALANDERLTIIRGAKNRADPPWIEAADTRVRHIRTNQIHKIIYDPTSLGGPPVQVDLRGDVGITMEMMQESKEVIEKAFYIRAFNPLLGLKNMTATEAMERLQLGLSETTPLVMKWWHEFLNPSLHRSYQLLHSKGRFRMPPPSLDGKKLKFTLISKAALALKQLETFAMMNTFEKAKLIAEVMPEILDNFDPDKMAAVSAEADCVMNLIMREQGDLKPVTVKQIRDGRAEAQQMQQEAEMSNMVADSISKVGKSAPAEQQ